MVKLSKLKWGGATLIEVLVALVIILVVWGMSVGLFNQVYQSGVPAKRVAVRKQMERLEQELTWAPVIQNFHQTIDSVDYYIEEVPDENSSLKQIKIMAKQGEMILGERNFLSTATNEHE